MKLPARSRARVVFAEALERRLCLSLPPLDPSFGTGGVVGTELAYPGNFVRLPDDGFLVNGLKTRPSPADQFSLSRLKPDGTYDDGFHAALFPETGPHFYIPYDFAIQPDGKIVVVGLDGEGTETRFAVGRFNADGTPDATFAGDGVRLLDTPFARPPWLPADNPHVAMFNALAIQPDGKIVAAGSSDLTVGVVARFTPDGQLDPTFGNGGWIAPQPELAFFDLAIQPDGKLVAAGSRYEEIDISSGDAAVVRINPDGTLDAGFGDAGRVLIVPPVTGHNIRGAASAVVLGADGRILLGGGGEVSPDDGQYEGFELFALNPDGSLDQGFGTAGRVATRFRFPDATSSQLWRLVMAPDGTLVASGSVQTATSGQFGVLAAYRADGAPLRSFGTEGQIDAAELYDVRGIQVLPDLSVFALGGSGVLAHYLKGPVVGVRADDVTTEIQIATRSPAFASSVGNLVFERSGDLSAPLKVMYSVAGSATSGADYVPLPEAVTFAAGQDAVAVPVTPVDDYLAEGPEHVTVSLADVPGYVTYSRTADVEIRDNEGPDRFEPNNSSARATRLMLPPGVTRTEAKLSLDTAADQDYFLVAGDNRGEITVSLTFDGSLSELNLHAYDLSGNLLATAPAVEGGRHLLLSLPAAMQYVLRVSGAANPDYALEMTYRRRVEVVGRYAFYNQSAFDGVNSGPNAADDAAIASGKAALLPGQTASPANVTSYEKGINGVMVDIANLPSSAPAPTAADFDFGGAPAPTSVTVRRGGGVGGSDRVTLIWPNYNPGGASPQAQAVANGWLTVTVRATARTGLSSPDVFSFGNLIGDAGDDRRVSALDLGAVKRLLNADAPLDSRVDFNRDRRVNAQDLGIVKRYLNRTLPAPAPPPGTAPAPAPVAGGVVRPLLEDEGDIRLLPA